MSQPTMGHGLRHTVGRRMDRRLRLVCGLWSAVCGLAVAGCVRRSLTIRTEPPGALVYVNDQLKGESPVTYDFLWYGWHRVTLRKEGFEGVDGRRLLSAPFYLWIPLDLVVELLPVPVRDERTWDYALTPAAAPVEPAPPVLIQPPHESPADRGVPPIQ